MTAYIERIVTEVVMSAETSENSPQADQRFLEKQKVEALIKAHNSHCTRIDAEGLDD